MVGNNGEQPVGLQYHDMGPIFCSATSVAKSCLSTSPMLKNYEDKATWWVVCEMMKYGW